MVRSVAGGMPCLGWGTVNRPGFVSCLNCTWLPLWLTLNQPSAIIAVMIS